MVKPKEMKKITVIITGILSIGMLVAQKAAVKKILIVTSNQHTYGDTKLDTANHFEEIVLAYDVFVKAGLDVDFVSPKGGAIPIGYIKTSDSIQKHYLYDSTLMGKLKNTYSPSQISDVNYSAVYFSGGGAAMFGVPKNKEIQKITIKTYSNNGIVSAVCHGTAGIAKIREKTGKYLFSGKKITGFPDAFEQIDKPYYSTFPFSIEQMVKRNGSIFKFSKKGWNSFYVTDGRLVTGQDPTATMAVAQQVVSLLSKNQ